MKKWFIAIILLVVCLTLAGGLFFFKTSNPQAAQVNIEGLFPGKQTHIFDFKDGYYLVGTSEPEPMDSSPDFLHADLYAIDKGMHQIYVESDVVSAKFTSNRDIIYSAHGNLMRRTAEQLTSVIAQNVESDFALSPDENDIVYVRHQSSDETSRLFSLNIGADAPSERVIAFGNGEIFWPVFSPDGGQLLFVAAFDGVLSWYRLDLNDSDPQVLQITNRGLKPGPDVLSKQYIPVPQMLESLRFTDDHTIDYETGTGRISLDIFSGEIVGGDYENMD
ncbi:MAG: PD40 domain-containing protein [Proteobacteria bacterium]|nr:PD40 domain-containing protein [Pseudomonadota bacterium]